LASAGAGAAVDLRTRRVPNALTLTVSAVGLTLAAAGATEVTLGAAFAGFLLGLALMLPGYLFGGTGGGDVKLLGALGAWMGPLLILNVFLYGAIAGGVLALIVAARRRRVGDTVRGAARLFASPRLAREAVEAADRDNRFPYAPAIAAGALLVVLGF
jgi:prepilin peptidase CpaA